MKIYVDIQQIWTGLWKGGQTLLQVSHFKLCAIRVLRILSPWLKSQIKDMFLFPHIVCPQWLYKDELDSWLFSCIISCLFQKSRCLCSYIIGLIFFQTWFDIYTDGSFALARGAMSYVTVTSVLVSPLVTGIGNSSCVQLEVMKTTSDYDAFKIM